MSAGRSSSLAFGIGVFSQAAQVLLLRELLRVAEGTETIVAVALSIWLVATALGAWAAAAWFADGRGRGAALTASVAAAAVLLPAALGFLRCSRMALEVPAGAYPGLGPAAALAMTGMAPVAFASAFGLGLLLQGAREEGRGAAAAYAWECAGALAAGMALTFLLLERAAPAALAVGASLALVLGHATASRRPRLAVPLAAVFGAAAAAAAPAVEERLERAAWAAAAPGQILLDARESRFAHLAVLEYAHQRSLFANGLLLDTAPDERAVDPASEEGDLAATLHLALVLHPRPVRVFLIGGLHGRVRAALAHAGARVDCCELDPAVTAFWRPYLPRPDREALDSPRVRLVHGDARRRLRTTEEPYDVIFCALPDPTTRALNRFYTREFFLEARGRLGSGGLFVTRLGAMEGALPESIARRNDLVFRTLRSVFPAVAAAPGAAHTLIASPSSDGIDLDPDRVVERFRARGVEAGAFPPEMFHLLLEPEATRQVNERYASSADPALPLNTDDRALACDLSQAVWAEFVSEEVGGGWRHGWAWGAMPWLAVAGATAWRSRRKRSAAAPVRPAGRRSWLPVWTMATTGVASMALFLALLFRFQDACGYLYHWIGLLSAAFMAGAGGGAAAGGATNRRWPRGDLRARMLVAEGGLVLVAAALFLLPDALPRAGSETAARSVFLLLAMFLGSLTGFEFALSAGGEAEGSAAPASLYAADSIGAAAGPLLLVLIAMPVAGLAGTCLVLAGLKGLTLVSWAAIAPGRS